MSSIRYQILEQIKATLESITVANGYGVDVNTVTRKLSDPLRFGCYPVIFIGEPPEDKLEGVTVSKTHVLMPVRCEAWVVDRIEDANADATRMLRDMERALLQDPALGGLAVELELAGNQMTIVERPALLGVALDFVVHFRHARSSPRAA